MCVDKRYMDNYDVLFLDIENPPTWIFVDDYPPGCVSSFSVLHWGYTRYTHVLFIWMMMMMMISTAQVVLSVKCGR